MRKALLEWVGGHGKEGVDQEGAGGTSGHHGNVLIYT
jgi:hypothetical protein